MTQEMPRFLGPLFFFFWLCLIFILFLIAIVIVVVACVVVICPLSVPVTQHCHPISLLPIPSLMVVAIIIIMPGSDVVLSEL
jgi:hypothetical protein